MTDERYIGNIGAFSEAELEAVRQKSVCVVGCGGLGGFVCNALVRFGIGSLTVIDGDVFTAGNLNRQMFAREDTIGLPKVQVCKEQLSGINSEVTVNAVNTMLDESNAEALLRGHDLIIDCLDSPQARMILENACEKLGLVFVHGAINGFMGQVAAVFPGDGTMKRLYADWEKSGKTEAGSPVFAVQTVSAIQCSEAIKILAGRETDLNGQLLLINLQENVFEVIRS